MPVLLELVLQYTYAGQQCVNRWNYLSNSTPAAVSFSFGLVSAFGGIVDSPSVDFPADTIMAQIQLMVSGGVVFENIQARDIYSATDFYDTPIPTGVIGKVVSSTGMSPFNAYGFVSSRVRTDIRRGYKRFAGVVEGNVGAFGVVEAGQLAVMQDLATLMSQNVIYDDETNEMTYTPVIVKKLKYETESGKTAYKYYPPEQEATQLANLATSISWTPYEYVRTQNSRQVGRGR